MSGFDPFTYNPQLASFFISPTRHETAIDQFGAWLRKSEPELYDKFVEEKPGLLNARNVIIAGDMSVAPATLQGLADTAPSDTSVPVTSWGQQVLDFVKSAVPTYYQARAQQTLLDVNVTRAEQGLPPLDSASLAPQVNVGVSNGVQTLGYVAIGGLVLVGLLSAFKGRR